MTITTIAAVLAAGRQKPSESPDTPPGLAKVSHDVLVELLDADPRLFIDGWHVYAAVCGLPPVLSVHVVAAPERVARAAVALADGKPVDISATASRDGEVLVTTWSLDYAGVRVALTSITPTDRRERPR